MTESGKKVVNSREDFELRHHIAHYTFLPAVGFWLVVAISAFPLYYAGYLSPSIAMALPWGASTFILAYLSVFGDYIIPAETYRNVKSGEWETFD